MGGVGASGVAVSVDATTDKRKTTHCGEGASERERERISWTDREQHQGGVDRGGRTGASLLLRREQ